MARGEVLPNTTSFDGDQAAVAETGTVDAVPDSRHQGSGLDCSSPTLISDAATSGIKTPTAFIIDFGGERSSGLSFTDKLSKYLPKCVKESVKQRAISIKNKFETDKRTTEDANGLKSKRSAPRLRDQQWQTKRDTKIRLAIRMSLPAVHLPLVPANNCGQVKGSTMNKNENAGGKDQDEESVSGTYNIEGDDEPDVVRARQVINDVFRVTEQSGFKTPKSKPVLQMPRSCIKNQVHCQKFPSGNSFLKQASRPKTSGSGIARTRAQLTGVHGKTTTNSLARIAADSSKLPPMSSTYLCHSKDRGIDGKASGRDIGKYASGRMPRPQPQGFRDGGNSRQSASLAGHTISCPSVHNLPLTRTRMNRTFKLRCEKFETNTTTPKAAKGCGVESKNQSQKTKCAGTRCAPSKGGMSSPACAKSLTTNTRQSINKSSQELRRYGSTMSVSSDGCSPGCRRSSAFKSSVHQARSLSTNQSCAPKTMERAAALRPQKVGAVLSPEVHTSLRRHQSPPSSAQKSFYPRLGRAPSPQRLSEGCSSNATPAVGRDCLLATLEVESEINSNATLSDLSQKIEKKLKEINVQLRILTTLPGWVSQKRTIEKELAATISSICEIEKHVSEAQKTLKSEQ